MSGKHFDPKPGDRVVAYDKYPAIVKSGPLAFNAYEIETDPISMPNRKRRKRVPMTVAQSNLRRVRGALPRGRAS